MKTAYFFQINQKLFPLTEHKAIHTFQVLKQIYHALVMGHKLIFRSRIRVGVTRTFSYLLKSTSKFLAF